MDFDAMKVDLKRALGRLPVEVTKTLPPLLLKYAPLIEPVIPGIMDDLGRHIGAAMAEVPLGALDRDGLTKAIEEVFTEMGIGVDDAPKAA